MFIFPASISNLVFQYPTERQVTFSTQICPFVGGGEQRYQIVGTPLKHWTAQPVILPDAAMAEIEAFFLSVSGMALSFQFVDPWDGTIYPTCYFKDDSLTRFLETSGRNTVTFTIVQGHP